MHYFKHLIMKNKIIPLAITQILFCYSLFAQIYTDQFNNNSGWTQVPVTGSVLQINNGVVEFNTVYGENSFRIHKDLSLLSDPIEIDNDDYFDISAKIYCSQTGTRTPNSQLPFSSAYVFALTETDGEPISDCWISSTPSCNPPMNLNHDMVSVIYGTEDQGGPMSFEIFIMDAGVEHRSPKILAPIQAVYNIQLIRPCPGKYILYVRNSYGQNVAPPVVWTSPIVSINSLKHVQIGNIARAQIRREFTGFVDDLSLRVNLLSEKPPMCENDDPAFFFAYPLGGTYSGAPNTSYISSLGIFDPSIAGPSTSPGHPITYSVYNTKAQCYSTQTIYQQVDQQLPIQYVHLGMFNRTWEMVYLGNTGTFRILGTSPPVYIDGVYDPLEAYASGNHVTVENVISNGVCDQIIHYSFDIGEIPCDAPVSNPQNFTYVQTGPSTFDYMWSAPSFPMQNPERWQIVAAYWTSTKVIRNLVAHGPAPGMPFTVPTPISIDYQALNLECGPYKIEFSISGTDGGGIPQNCGLGLMHDVQYAGCPVARMQKPTGISPPNQVSADKLRIYPNPAQNVIHIEGLSENFTSLEILNQSGQVVSRNYDENQTDIDVSKLNPGLYIIKITNIDDINIHKIVIQ